MVDGQHLGTGKPSVDSAQPAQAARLGLEEPVGRMRLGLQQHRPPVGELQAGGGVDVAAGDRCRRHHRRAEELLGLARGGGLAGHRGLPAPTVVRSCSVSSIAVRSTMASTSVKPLSPP